MSRCITFLSFTVVITLMNCGPYRRETHEARKMLKVLHDKRVGSISVYKNEGKDLLLIQNAKQGMRPYIHPTMAPDGNGQLTEFSPEHHKHQTGLYWGLKKVNGRDYFMNLNEDYWKQVSVSVVEEMGARVQWQTVYDLLDDKGNSILTETQTWSFTEIDGKFLLDLEWRGVAKTDITMEKFYVGGLFLRMPWRNGIRGEVVNAVGQKNADAEGQRAIWNDVGIQVPGRGDLAHIAMLDHPDNKDFPIPWRVDNELGVGPSRQISGDWKIGIGETEVIRYRLIVYTGELNQGVMTDAWKNYACE